MNTNWRRSFYRSRSLAFLPSSLALRQCGLTAFLFALGLATSLPATAADSKANNAQGRVRTDGVYALKLPGSDAVPKQVVVRFYDDGYAIEATASDFTKLSTWLNRDGNPELLPARWTMEDDKLILRESSGFKEQTREGRLSEGAWSISDKVVFRFVPVAFPKTSPGANRRPYFVGVGKAVRVFNYDSAGRQKGMSWQFEVKAADPDGDAVEITWMTGSGKIIGTGNAINWEATENGVLRVVLTDARGAKTITTSNF